MPEKPENILLVVPVWKDSARLADFGITLAKALAASDLPIRWIIADDGSGPEEHERLEGLRLRFAEIFSQVEVHFAEKHQGKGSVVREAWALAPDAEWLAFMDADGSVSAVEMFGLIDQAVQSGTSVLGIRKRTESTQVNESLVRGLAHRGFLLATRLLLGLRSADPQCGAKVIKGADYRAINALLVEKGFAFDSELLAALNHRSRKWSEVPVNWSEKQGGTVKLSRDTFGMISALLRIRSARRSW